MATRRTRFERRMEKAREERLVENLEKASDVMNGILADVERGRTDDLMDAMDSVDDAFGRAYRQAERMEADEG